jgi:CRP-like cAMP-binding protein
MSTATQDSIFTPVLQRWNRRVALSDADRQAVLELPSVRRNFERDAYIVREAEPITHCCLLLAGFAFRQKLISSGARQIISIHMPSEFLDAQNAMFEQADHSVQSLGRSEAAMIPKSALVELMAARPRIAQAVWLDTLVDASVFREWVVNVGRRSARSRIAHLLCELVLRMRTAGMCNETTCQFPLTQEQVADATGLTSVHTNRTLQALRKEGLIQLRAGRLTVLDWRGLAEVGEFNDRYLHQAA